MIGFWDLLQEFKIILILQAILESQNHKFLPKIKKTFSLTYFFL